MKIDLTCPVELWQYAMPTETDAECTFVMNNLSDKVVTSVQVTLNCFDGNDEPLFRQTERIQGLKAGVGERFTVVVMPSEWKGVEGVDLVIEKVWFDDATIWRRGNAQLTYYTPNALPPGRALDELRFVAGKDASGYPQWQDYVWMCVCGRANAHERERCCRCERRRDAVFASFSRENVQHVIAEHEQKLAQAARKAREENNLLQENQEKQRAAKRRRRRNAIRLAGTLALLLAAAVVTVLWGIPTVKYNTALDLLNQGHYDQALEAFGQLGDYRDAQTQMLECNYQKADALCAKETAETHEQACALYRALESYRNSVEKAEQTAYELGLMYLEEGSYEKAAAQFEQLGDYRDSVQQISECTYRKACAMLESGGYEAARALFAGLGEYADSQEKAQACLYRMAVAEMDGASYPAALELLQQLDNYADSQLLVGECYYNMAEAELANGEFEKAGEIFLLAGDYEDARLRASECLYKLAQEQRENGNYEKAMTLFLRVPDYENSLELARQCVYDQATALMENGDLPNAIALFETITDFEDVSKQLDLCRFQQAEQALEEGDAEQAERLLLQVGSHKGLESQLKKVRYQLAKQAMENGDYQSALERYEWLGAYKDSKNKAKQCRYALAKAAQEAGSYEKAISVYTELGNYKESSLRIKQCRYAMAKLALDSQDYAQAIVLFTQLGSFEDSKAQLEQAQYQQAIQLKNSGDMDQAVEMLKKLGSEEADAALVAIRMEEAAKLEAESNFAGAAQLYAAIDSEAAQEKALNCLYQAAEALYASGDLSGAAAAFHELGAYQDSAQRSEQCYNEYYGQVAQHARERSEAKDAQGVVETLKHFEMNVLSQTYADLPELFAKACLTIADQLYAEGKAYEAIPYYQRAGEKEKLARRAYLILGQWESATGKTAVFRTDGTCELFGEKLYFRVSNFSLYTGETPDDLAITHKISVLDEKGMSLRDQRNGQDVLYKLSRIGSFELEEMPLPDVQEIPQETGFVPIVTPEPADEMMVTEDADEEDAEA